MNLEEEHAREEYDWIATDSVGEIGFFSTAGAGEIPEAATPHDAVLQQTLERIRQLPECCEAMLPHPPKGYVADWVTVAKRGIYAYDWNGSAYELIARPTRAVKIGALGDKEIEAIGAAIKLRVRFSSGEQVRIR